ncbi:MAG: bis(5'-nucleosyl)-tetraphosphatase (symmetrical) YqeK, partial [Eubacteriales bacterium]|nr:bis(5'-nucleosyl)-tetraphosphatase (symmetrical) YqeK [Eubacteriales bacterium]
YKNNYFEKYSEYVEKIKENLTEKKFNHSLEVAKEAKKLANCYGINEEKAFLAGLLHDCAKCFGLDKIKKICEENNYILDNVTEKQPDLAHSFLGYFVAKNDYGIEDEEILNAIKYHTTGKANMTLFEKIIYIADYIEPTRTYFDGLERARYLAYENIDEAMAYILKNTISFNEKKGRLIHDLSKEAYEYYKK